jgi:hypothetical protein
LRGRYHTVVRDTIFVLSVLGFFAAAVLFVRACERVVGSGSAPALEEQRER